MYFTVNICERVRYRFVGRALDDNHINRREQHMLAIELN